MPPPSTQAILLILLAMMAYAMSAVLNWISGRRKDQAPTRLTMACLAAGITLSLGVVVLRVAHGHMPAASGFDTFALMALLTGTGAAYLWAVDALGRAGLVLMPVATVWAGLAVVLSGPRYHDFAHDTWTLLHVTLASSAALAFAAAAVGGWRYLRKYDQLRSKDPRMFEGSAVSLERLGRFLRRALPIAFVLVTATVITGLFDALQPRLQGFFHDWKTHPKMLAAGLTWVIYSIALHAAYARRFRARVAAILSVVGFVLLVAVLLASMLIQI
jgi:ABC-type uncharacterized transport system permease subunit